MNERLCWTLLLAVAAAGLLLVSAQEIRAAKSLPLPDKVLGAVERTLPGWEVVRVEWDRKFYWIKLSGPDGEARLQVAPDGFVRSVHQDLLRTRLGTELPQEVRRAISKAFPERQPSRGVKITRTEITYRIELDGDKRPGLVTIAADGKILEVERK